VLDAKSPQVAYIVIRELVMYSSDDNPVSVIYACKGLPYLRKLSDDVKDPRIFIIVI
jgi:hypothetical protein